MEGRRYLLREVVLTKRNRFGVIAHTFAGVHLWLQKVIGEEWDKGIRKVVVISSEKLF